MYIHSSLVIQHEKETASNNKKCVLRIKKKIFVFGSACQLFFPLFILRNAIFHYVAVYTWERAGLTG